jgi:hypothetical protein
MEMPNNTNVPNVVANIPKPTRNKRIFLILFVVVLLVMGAGLFYFSRTSSVKSVVSPLSSFRKVVSGPKNCKVDQTSTNYKKGASLFTKLDFPNNKFGVYSYADRKSLEAAGPLVNSSGGDWGWVLIPFNIKQVSHDYWNSVLEITCQQHLIPILQLFNDSKPPTEIETRAMADFLAKLKWPTKLKFITAYNEVNASEYWGGKIDPEGYAQTLNLTIDELKRHDKNFFVMNGAFNSATRTNPGFTTDLGVFTSYLNLPDYLDRMDKAVPGIFKKIDGWAAHTYPLPAYKGKPTDIRVTGESDEEAGRNTIRSYQFDLRVLKSKFNVGLPVFITETGWPHREGTQLHSEWLPAETIAEYYQTAFQDLFLTDPQVVAVTPFIMTMTGLDNFAFIDSKGNPYPQYNAVKNIPKTAGRPELE